MLGDATGGTFFEFGEKYQFPLLTPASAPRRRRSTPLARTKADERAATANSMPGNAGVARRLGKAISLAGSLAATCGVDYSPPVMKIVFSSDAGLSRPKAVEYVRSLKAQNPRLKVVDIGGAANPWSADVVDAYVDMRPVPGLRTLTGDIHDPGLWREIKSEGFDFCICSHTLEDIRDPLFVLAQIRETFSQGYIAVPNKHVEFSHIE